MANPMKQLGTSHETAIVNWFKANGWPYAARKTLKGSADQGDIQLSERVPFVVEAKTAKATTDKANISGWLKELEAEIIAAEAETGAIIMKKRGTTDVAEYVAIMPVKVLNHLLQRAYGPLQ